MKQFNFTYRLLMVYLIVQIPIGCLKSQEFSIPIYFEDAKGNKDTIIYGLDEIGTKDMDTIFGEKNIIDVPINKELDVRITDELYQRHFNDSTGQFHTKKQIVSNKGDLNTDLLTEPVWIHESQITDTNNNSMPDDENAFFCNSHGRPYFELIDFYGRIRFVRGHR